MAPVPRSLRDALGLAALLASCLNPTGCSISPKPEPPDDALPSLDPGDLRITPARDYGDPTGIEGGPGSASPPGATLRIWNLDQPSPPIDTTVESDGSFAAYFDVFVGEELRVQLIADGRRSPPADFVVSSDSGPAQLAQRALGDCLLLEPPLEALYPAVSAIRVTNACAFAVELAAPSLRRPVAGLGAGQGTPWPATLPAGAVLEVALNVQEAMGEFEEILLLNATSPQPDRRPITVRGSAP